MTVPPCAGHHAIFDSRAPEDHAKAKTLCRECPILAACLTNLEAVKRAPKHLGGSPEGTWAGQLVGGALSNYALGRARARADREAS